MWLSWIVLWVVCCSDATEVSKNWAARSGVWCPASECVCWRSVDVQARVHFAAGEVRLHAQKGRPSLPVFSRKGEVG